MASIPKTMRSLVAPRYCEPKEYEVMEMPVPTIQRPDEVLLKMHAANIFTSDTRTANGMFKLLARMNK